VEPFARPSVKQLQVLHRSCVTHSGGDNHTHNHSVAPHRIEERYKVKRQDLFRFRPRARFNRRLMEALNSILHQYGLEQGKFCRKIVEYQRFGNSSFVGDRLRGRPLKTLTRKKP
jgi:hypothetical protein